MAFTLRCLTLLVLSLLAAPASAQFPPIFAPPADGMVGESWDLVTTDGNPVSARAEYYMEVTRDDNDVVKGQFYKKVGDNPPVAHEDPVVLNGGPLRYTWESGELHGWMQWNPLTRSYLYYTSAQGGLTRALRQRDDG